MIDSDAGLSVCRLLALPLELRLQIYIYVLQHSPTTITFSTAQLVGSKHHRRAPFPGIAENQIPVIEPRYEASLLSLTNPAVIPASSLIRREEQGICDYQASAAILLVNRRIYLEIIRNIPLAKNTGLSGIYISFPNGLHVFHTIGSHLLRGVKTIHIVGQHQNDSFSAAHAVMLPHGPSRALKATSAQLATLAGDVLGPQPRNVQLHLRIYYPGDHAYDVLWGDDYSPLVVALQSIAAADIEIELWSGSNGIGVNLVARPNPDGKRNVSTVWTRFAEDLDTTKEIDTWLLDPAWSETPWLHGRCKLNLSA